MTTAAAQLVTVRRPTMQAVAGLWTSHNHRRARVRNLLRTAVGAQRRCGLALDDVAAGAVTIGGHIRREADTLTAASRGSKRAAAEKPGLLGRSAIGA
jgi:hypothetical protein